MKLIPIALSMACVFILSGCACSTAASKDPGTPSAVAKPVSPQTPGPVIYFDAQAVQTAFAKGGALLDRKDTNYQIITGRRVEPGLCEVHTFDTDLIYVVDGGATFVTGGTAVESKETAPGEFRGSGITGGTDRKMSKGDVIVVPAGTPHWFKEIKGEFLYFIIKVR